MSAGREIRLRRALAEEADLLGGLCLRSKAIWGYDEAFLEACRAELRLGPEAIARGLVQVAEIGETLAGLAEISVGGETAYLEKLFVEPEFIGRKVGARLMAWTRAEAALLGARRMVIESDPGAAEFYRRCGARDEGFTPSKSIPGRMLPRLVLPLPAIGTATTSIEFRVDDLGGEAIQALIARHLAGMHKTSPPESVHALGIEKLKQSGISFWSAWVAGELAGCGALKRIDATRGEIKSMRVADAWLGKGVGRAVLDHIIAEARRMGMKSLWLETGSAPAFAPALKLYETAGFKRCGPFEGYVEDPFSVFMTRDI